VTNHGIDLFWGMHLLAEVNFNPQMFMDLLWNQAAVWGPKLLLAALTLFIGWRVARILGVLLEKALDRRHIDPTLKPFLTSLLTMLVKAGVVVTAISTAGIQATSFAALFASAGLAIGLALSGTLQNFAGGVILLIVRPFKVGDVIEVQSFIGTVSKIEIFQTILITGDNKMIHIPNGKLQNDSIVNYSALPDRRVDFSFGIGYNDDIDKARDIIAGVIKGIPEISDTPEYNIVVGQLADSSVNLTVRVWAKTPDYWKVHFTMNEQVKKALDTAGISIPFPQRDIHVLREKL
jgi:small conductance mechanosensitive channel